MSEQASANGNRLDRIERALESLIQTSAGLARQFDAGLELLGGLAAQQQRQGEALAGVHEEHARFRADLREMLAAQVLMADIQRQADARIVQLAEAQQHTEERLNALIAVVDEVVRKRPQA